MTNIWWCERMWIWNPCSVYGAHLVAMLGPVGSMLDICRTYIWHFSEFWELRPFQNGEKPHDSRAIKYTSRTNPIDACTKKNISTFGAGRFLFFVVFLPPSRGGSMTFLFCNFIFLTATFKRKDTLHLQLKRCSIAWWSWCQIRLYVEWATVTCINLLQKNRNCKCWVPIICTSNMTLKSTV